MRKSPLRDVWAHKGSVFQERYGVEVSSVVSNKKAEYFFVRDAVGITDFSYMQKFRVPADTGLDFLDALFPGNIAKIRFCRVAHTFLADEEGHSIADCYVANNDEDFIIFCESIVDDQTLKSIFDAHGAEQAGLKDITNTHVVIGIDGYTSWAVVKELFGADVLGLPYLSIESYPFENENIVLLRAGKTSEFGYLIMAPKEIGPQLAQKVFASAHTYKGGLCGVDVHNELRLEGRFFNVFGEGARVRDPLILGLQWMIDFEKETFLGRGAIVQRRQQGLQKKIIGIKTDASAKLFVGAEIFHDGKKVSSVEASCFSYVVDAYIGLAVFSVESAYSGLRFNVGAPDGPIVASISMPPIVPKSLNVKLDEL